MALLLDDDGKSSTAWQQWSAICSLITAESRRTNGFGDIFVQISRALNEKGLTSSDLMQAMSTGNTMHPSSTAVGSRVYHPRRHVGTVMQIDHDDARGKPYCVEFDSGEVHSYSAGSLAKLSLLPNPVKDAAHDVKEGGRVWHGRRGAATVRRIDNDDEQGKPYHVYFDGGEMHQYSNEAMTRYWPQ